MKLKSFFAGALGLLVLFAGQGAAGQEGALAPPDRESSILPPPDESPFGAGASGREGAQRGRREGQAAPKQAGGGLFGNRQEQGTKAPADAGGREESKRAGEARREQGTGSQAAAGDTSAREALPRTGLYMGAMAGTVFPIYHTDDEWDDNNIGSHISGKPTFGGGLSVGWDFGFVAAETGALISSDRAKTTVNKPYYGDDVDLMGISLLVPLIIKLDFHLGPVVLQPLAGGYVNFALGDLKWHGYDPGDTKAAYANPLFGLMFGGALGFKLGRGSLFVDSRYVMDLGSTAMGSHEITNNTAMRAWKRSGVMLNLGYQFYLGGKK
jgi:hypothetical protein